MSVAAKKMYGTYATMLEHIVQQNCHRHMLYSFPIITDRCIRKFFFAVEEICIEFKCIYTYMLQKLYNTGMQFLQVLHSS